MSEVKDLYAILGVLPDAEPDVLKAVYLALAKKYHPDTSGSSEHEEKLKEINAAYEILRDPVQRREYDATRSQQNDDTGQYEPDVDDEDLTAEALQSDWEFAVEYRPELGDLLRSVATISPTLSIVFQSTILNRRSFDNASLIADELVAGFMVEYSSTPYLLFMFGEYLNMTLMCAMFTILFLGGWYAPVEIGVQFIPPVFWFMGKCLFMFFMFAMVKAIVPRYRYDQLMRLGWKVFLPVSLMSVVIVSTIVVFVGGTS